VLIHGQASAGSDLRIVLAPSGNPIVKSPRQEEPELRLRFAREPKKIALNTQYTLAHIRGVPDHLLWREHVPVERSF
jgi:hypothetical protein